jgi:uncharacterized protein YciI
VDWFVYCRDNPGSAPLRARLGEQHQAYMDAFVERMTARGPTLDPEGEMATGSMHIVDLPDVEAARAFAVEEPCYRAGVYGEVLVRRWRNLLGGTMWELAADDGDADRVLVIGHAEAGLPADAEFAAGHPLRDRLVVCGPLLSDDGSLWLGTVVAVERSSPTAVEALLADEPFARAGLYDRLEIHPWRFGGRR